MISPDTLARIKERTDIVALIGETVRLTRRGRSFVGLCPFHKEKSPSFHVHPERGFFHCFGCQESGSAIDFVMKTNGLDFLEAVRMLADRSGIVLEESVNAEASRAQKSEKDELYAVMMLAATYYERCLGLAGASALGGRAHPLAGYALRELDKRGMPSPGSQGPEAEHWQKAAAAFRLGYAPPGWDGLARFLREQGISAGVGERAGLLVAGQRGHYDRFRHRLMFAVVDALGRVIAFSGRALAAPDPEELKRHEPSAPSYDGEPPAKYINSPESPIYKKGEQLFGLFQAKAALRQRQEALLVEGNFDVVTLHAAGIEHAIAPLGTAFTAEQAKLIKRFAPSVVVLFDGDAAGKKATRAARIPCREGGLDARVATLPAGMDPDELVRTQGAAALLARLKEAKGMLEHLIQDALDDDRFQGAGVTEQAARVRAVVKLLTEEPDPNLKLQAKRLADELSNKLIVRGAQTQDLTQLERMVASALHTPEPAAPRADAPPRAAPLTTEQRFALAILGAVLDFPELLSDPDVTAGLSLIEGDAALAVAGLRRKIRASTAPGASTEKTLDVADLLATLPHSIQSFSARRLASPSFENASEAKAEALDNISNLERLLSKRQKHSTINVLERSASSLDDEGIAVLREQTERLRKLKRID
ncbi:MAG: toprim domain-containing protein [Polyangiaceae bacterium]|nr:toprim domain-containing protein [Polyangiaceae bacterium]